MSEKKEYNEVLIEIGKMLMSKRKALGEYYKNREEFIYRRSEEILGGEPWISTRHLASVELGKNWLGIEKLIQLAYALEEAPKELFGEIVEIYTNVKSADNN